MTTDTAVHAMADRAAAAAVADHAAGHLQTAGESL